MTKMYLKPNVVAEPLCWHWYAWAHLISPLTAAMNIAFRHIPIMERFLQKAETYRTVSNQKFQTGPIIHLDASRIPLVKNLLAETKRKCQKLIILANSIKKLTAATAQADGSSLEQYYTAADFAIRGLVELVYDINHQPGLRFFEQLAYQDYYENSYEMIGLLQLASDQRAFILGTPRFASEDNLHFSCAFSSVALDQLFLSQFYGANILHLAETLNISAEALPQFQSYFTMQEPNSINENNYLGNGTRIRYFGHACILLQTKNVNILLDPLLSYQPTHINDIERFTYADLPDVLDYVIISHAHQDHFSVEALLKIRHKVKTIIVPKNSKGNLIDPALKLILVKLGFRHIIEMEEMDKIILNDGEIYALPFLGEHAELDVQSKLTYLIQLNEKKFCFAVDTNNFDNQVYERTFRYLAPIDTLFVGMECAGGPLNWLYGALITQPYDSALSKTRTLSGSDFPKAWGLATASGCKEAYVYSMGQEPWLNYIMNINYTETSPQIIESDKFVAACQKNNIISERLFARQEWIYE